MDILDFWPKRVNMFPSIFSYSYYYRAIYNQNVGYTMSCGRFSGAEMQTMMSYSSSLWQGDKLGDVASVSLIDLFSYSALILYIFHLIQMH